MTDVTDLLKKSAIVLTLGFGLALAGCGDAGDTSGGGQGGLGDRDWGDFGEESDIVLGDLEAPVSIVEYASVTCGHCAQFHVFTFPFLEEEYINAGLVRYTMRPLPTPPTNMARLGFMVARCVPESRYYNFIDALMRTQPQWAFDSNPDARTRALAQLAAQAGLSQSAFDACRLDQAGLDRINAAAEASAGVGVRSTPTFFVNGEMVEGAMSWEQFEPYIIAHLPEDLRPADTEAAEDADESVDSE